MVFLIYCFLLLGSGEREAINFVGKGTMRLEGPRRLIPRESFSVTCPLHSGTRKGEARDE